jgi:uncharacterized protein (UPF0335 family)
MATQKKKAIKLPSNEQITNAKDDLSAYLEKIVRGEISVDTEKETITSKLMLIKDIIEPLKQHIIDKKITYTTLSKVLEEKINLKVSAQTLRSFCQNQLDFPKTTRKKSLATKEKEESTEKTKSFNAENKLSQNNMKFD